MNLKKKLRPIVIAGFISMITACGGGGGDTNTSSNEEIRVVESGTDALHIRSPLYNLSDDSSTYLYKTNGCYAYLRNIFSIYENGFAKIAGAGGGGRVDYRTCFVERAFSKVPVEDTTNLNAGLFTTLLGSNYNSIFFDENNQTYYELDAKGFNDPFIIEKGDYTLIEIINDGLYGVLKNNTDGKTYKILVDKSFKEVELSEVGIVLNSNDIYEGNPDQVFDSGVIMARQLYEEDDTSYKPFDLWGARYNYKLDGCEISSISADIVYIYNDGFAIVKDSRSLETIDSCYVSGIYQKVNLSDGVVNADFLNGYTFYESNSGIYYDTVSSIGSKYSAYKLVEIVRHGNYGIISDGSENNILIRLRSASKKIF